MMWTVDDPSWASELEALWVERWAATRPVAHQLRDEHVEWWLRFHSLPRSKRLARRPAERREALSRHHAIIDHLRTRTGGLELIVIAQDYDDEDVAHGWARKALPDARLWKVLPPAEADVDPSGGEDAVIPATFLWVSAPQTDTADLDELLLTVIAGGAGSTIVSDTALGWFYAPYCGGGDVITPRHDLREELGRLHPSWLAPLPPGL
jgi:hypothetical protein